MTPECERLVLVGFMGAGKSTVGAILARRLGWRFLDLDREIEARRGASVAEIFAAEGEPGFRRLEARASAAALEAREVVIATGGGWAASAEVTRPLPAGTLSVWLQLSAAEAWRRLGPGAGAHRPLLRGPDPAAAIARLLAAREPHYRTADLAVSTEGKEAAAIAEEIIALLRERRATGS